MNPATLKKIIIICFICISANCYSNSINNHNASYVFAFPNKITDTIELKTKYGLIKIINKCDSTMSILYNYGELYDSFLNDIVIESEKTKIHIDKASLIFELNDSGQLLKCRIGKTAMLREFNRMLQKFMIEINLGYQNTTLSTCTDKTKKGKTFLEIPFYFHLDQF